MGAPRFRRDGLWRGHAAARSGFELSRRGAKARCGEFQQRAHIERLLTPARQFRRIHVCGIHGSPSWAFLRTAACKYRLSLRCVCFRFGSTLSTLRHLKDLVPGLGLGSLDRTSSRLQLAGIVHTFGRDPQQSSRLRLRPAAHTVPSRSWQLGAVLREKSCMPSLGRFSTSKALQTDIEGWRARRQCCRVVAPWLVYSCVRACSPRLEV